MLTGCATAAFEKQAKAYYGDSQSKWQTKKVGVKALAAAGNVGEADNRLNDVTELKTKLAKVEARWKAARKLLNEGINFDNNIKTSTMILSASSAIAATALTTASSANKVWSVVFAGLAGSSGASGLFSSLGNNYNAAQQAAGEQTQMDAYNANYAKVDLDTLTGSVNDTTLTPAQWGTKVHDQRVAIEALETVVDKAEIPQYPADPKS